MWATRRVRAWRSTQQNMAGSALARYGTGIDDSRMTGSTLSEPKAERADGDGVLLRASSVSRRFRGLLALTDYNLTLRRGEILGVIGPNGAGKTTMMNLISGLTPLTSGSLSFTGRRIDGMAPHDVTRLGIARTFQTIRLFGKLSVLDNVKVAQQLRGKPGFWETLLSAPSFHRKERELERLAMQRLDDLGLGDLHALQATALPYGSQRKVEIARALALEPKVLLLDEPAAGMNPNETAELLGFIRSIHQRYGLTIVVVEHDMSLIMRLCDRIQVLNYGQTIAEGNPEEVRANPAVVEAYLGTRSQRRAAERESA